MTDNRHHHTRPASRGEMRLALITLTCLAILTGTAAGDELRIKNSTIPYTKLTVERIADGQVYYVMDATGNAGTRDVAMVELIKLDDYPQLGQAEDAIRDNPPNYTAAINAFQSVANQAKQDWLRHWTDYRLVTVAADAGRPRVAAAAYLRLARANERDYLGNPPVEAVRRAERREKARIIEELEGALRTVPEGAALTGVRQLLEAARADVPSSNDDNDEDTTGNGPAEQEPPVAMTSVGGRYIPGDAIGKMLENDEANAALDAIEKRLKSPGAGRALLFYERGLARLMLAESAEDAGSQVKLVKDAGLDFARVMIYFRYTTYATPATVELGFVHEHLGRFDIAARLYDQAYEDAGKLPAMQSLRERIEKLKRGLNERRKAAGDGSN